MAKWVDDKFHLTEQQALFVETYVRNGFNGTKAAITAGYSKKSAGVQASKLLTVPKIQDYLNHCKEEMANQVDVSKEFLMERLYQIATNSAEGNQLKAIDLLAKMNGYYAPQQQEVTNKYSEIENATQNLSDEEIEKLLESFGEDKKLKRVK